MVQEDHPPEVLEALEDLVAVERALLVLLDQVRRDKVFLDLMEHLQMDAVAAAVALVLLEQILYL